MKYSPVLEVVPDQTNSDGFRSESPLLSATAVDFDDGLIRVRLEAQSPVNEAAISCGRLFATRRSKAAVLIIAAVCLCLTLALPFHDVLRDVAHKTADGLRRKFGGKVTKSIKEQSASDPDKDHHHWSYDTGSDHGPINWHKSHVGCSGKYQSPINLAVDESMSGQVHRIQLENYDLLVGGISVKNNGHTLILHHIPRGITMSGSGLPASYMLDSIHIHWGADDDKGSEHAIEGKYFPLEMHLVHVKVPSAEEEIELESEEYYGTGELAPKSLASFKLAVLGVLFELSETDSSVLDNFLRHAANDLNENFVLNVSRLLPDDKSKYFRYLGSLTTPPCNETVIWTVFHEQLSISKKQLEILRSLYGDHAGLKDNFRPLQPLNGRWIYYSHGTPFQPELYKKAYDKQGEKMVEHHSHPSKALDTSSTNELSSSSSESSSAEDEEEKEKKTEVPVEGKDSAEAQSIQHSEPNQEEKEDKDKAKHNEKSEEEKSSSEEQNEEKAKKKDKSEHEEKLDDEKEGANEEEAPKSLKNKHTSGQAGLAFNVAIALPLILLCFV